MSVIAGRAWSIIRVPLTAWLRTRALVLPDLRRRQLAVHLGISTTTILEIELALRDSAIRALDDFNP